MSPSDWERVKDLFDAAALDHDAVDRARYIAAACEDESLRSEVQRLLAAHDRADSFLEHSPLKPDGSEHLQIGQSLSHYQIVAELGEGGMGTVYRATDLQLRRPVAIKVLRRHLPIHLEPDRRLLGEARAASALNHPNIAHIYEIGEADGVHFIAMEYIEGRTLAARIAEGPLELAGVVEFGVQAASALTEAHEHGIVHRDIKPSNLMIGSRGEIKVLDFGLAKVPSEMTVHLALAEPRRPDRGR